MNEPIITISTVDDFYDVNFVEHTNDWEIAEQILDKQRRAYIKEVERVDDELREEQLRMEWQNEQIEA